MGVNINTYIILGAKLNPDMEYEQVEKYLDNAHEPKSRGFLVLYDGMSGDYVIAGHVIKSTGNYEHFEDPIEIKDPTACARNKIVKDIKDKLGISVKAKEIKTFVVAHHT